MNAPVLLVCMGVSGSGKSTVGRALSNEFGLEFIEADDYHSPENQAHMAAGKPLDDAMREPWINALCGTLEEALGNGRNCVMACSCLRRLHRERFRELGFDTGFIHLAGSADVIRARMRDRPGHFMPAGLLESQLADLESTDGEPDVVVLDIEDDLPVMLARASNLAKRILKMGED